MQGDELIIDIGRNYVTRVNLHTWERLKLDRFRWRPQIHKGPPIKVYAQCWRGGQLLTLHRLILGAEKGQLVDHIDGNPLNNTDANLRFCTQKQNCANTRKRRRNSSGYKGVYWNHECKKWMAKLQTRVNGKMKVHYLGMHVDKHRAARAYDRKALELFGEYAGLNFTDGAEHWDQTAD